MFLIAFSCQGYKRKKGKNFFTPLYPACGGGISGRKAFFLRVSTGQSVSPLKKIKHEAAAQRRPVRSERKNRVFSANDRPYGLKRNAFQTENALGTVNTNFTNNFNR